MDLIVAAKVWHYWLGAALAIPAVLAVVATIIGYLVKVVATKHPRSS